MPEKFKVDKESVRGLAKLLEETGLTEIEYQVGTQRIRVARTSAPAAHYVPLPPASSPSNSPHELPSAANVIQGEAVSSPMVGTAYLSTEPGAPPFIKVGDVVQKGDTLLIIEAMKNPPSQEERDVMSADACSYFAWSTVADEWSQCFKNQLGSVQREDQVDTQVYGEIGLT